MSGSVHAEPHDPSSPIGRPRAGVTAELPVTAEGRAGARSQGTLAAPRGGQETSVEPGFGERLAQRLGSLCWVAAVALAITVALVASACGSGGADTAASGSSRVTTPAADLGARLRPGITAVICDLAIPAAVVLVRTPTQQSRYRSKITFGSGLTRKR